MMPIVRMRAKVAIDLFRVDYAHSVETDVDDRGEGDFRRSSGISSLLCFSTCVSLSDAGYYDVAMNSEESNQRLAILSSSSRTSYLFSFVGLIGEFHGARTLVSFVDE